MNLTNISDERLKALYTNFKHKVGDIIMYKLKIDDDDFNIEIAKIKYVNIDTNIDYDEIIFDIFTDAVSVVHEDEIIYNFSRKI